MRTRQRDRTRTHRVQVKIGHATPIHGGTDIQAFISTWKAAEGLFHDREHLGYKVTLDATDTLQLLDMTAKRERGIEKPFKDRLKNRMSKKLAPLGSQILLTFRSSESADPENPIIQRFLQNLYLAMNLSVPGSCNLHRASFQARPTARTRRIYSRGEQDVWLDLTAEDLESAWHSALKHGWPRLERIDLVKTWEWLERVGALAVDVAREPWERALFTILRVGSPQSHDPDLIQLCVQAVEALLGEGAPVSVIKRRVEFVLSAPNTNKGWYNELHKTRSKLAHGAAPLVRPGSWLREEEPGGEVLKYLDQIDQACAVLLALIQALVLKNARTFQISEVIALC